MEVGVDIKIIMFLFVLSYVAFLGVQQLPLISSRWQNNLKMKTTSKYKNKIKENTQQH